jgi:hypothetical protein
MRAGGTVWEGWAWIWSIQPRLWIVGVKIVIDVRSRVGARLILSDGMSQKDT